MILFLSFFVITNVTLAHQTHGRKRTKWIELIFE
jgi:hypothetical protein